MCQKEVQSLCLNDHMCPTCVNYIDLLTNKSLFSKVWGGYDL